MINDKHWELLETNLTLALKLYAQAIEKARWDPQGGMYLNELVSYNWRGWTFNYSSQSTTNLYEYYQSADELEAALLNVPGQEWGQNWYDGDYEAGFYNNNQPQASRPTLPNEISFDTLMNIVPDQSLRAGSQDLQSIFYNLFLRPAVALAIAGDYIHSDQVRVGTGFYSPRIDNWGYEPDLYVWDLYFDQVITGSRTVDYWLWTDTTYYYLPAVTGAEAWWIPEERNTSGAGAELFWDLIDLFYEVEAKQNVNINYEENYQAVEQDGSASYRFSQLPTRVVTKVLPANYDLSRIEGTVRLSGGIGNGDTLEVNARDSGGLEVYVEKQVLELAEYTFSGDSAHLSALPSGITQEDVRSALLRANKESQVGIINDLLDDPAVTSATVEVSTDEIASGSTGLLSFTMDDSLTAPIQQLRQPVCSESG